LDWNQSLALPNILSVKDCRRPVGELPLLPSESLMVVVRVSSCQVDVVFSSFSVLMSGLFFLLFLPLATCVLLSSLFRLESLQLNVAVGDSQVLIDFLSPLCR